MWPKNLERTNEMSGKPSSEEVAVRAYEIYLNNGREDGHDVEHWLLAEEELAGKPASEPERDPRSVIQRTVAEVLKQRSAAASAVSSASKHSTVSPSGKS
jgi:hypothetical protein